MAAHRKVYSPVAVKVMAIMTESRPATTCTLNANHPASHWLRFLVRGDSGWGGSTVHPSKSETEVQSGERLKGLVAEGCFN